MCNRGEYKDHYNVMSWQKDAVSRVQDLLFVVNHERRGYDQHKNEWDDLKLKDVKCLEYFVTTPTMV